MKVDFNGLVIGFSDDSVERSYYLDRDTGRVFNVLEDHDDPETQKLVWQLEADTRGRYVQIPTLTLEQRIDEQDAFVESLDEGDLKASFEKLIENDHDGSKFAEFVTRDRAARDAWRAYRKARSRERATDWVESLGLKT